MRLMITGRHVAVTPALRDYIETRMERLDRYGLKLGTLQIPANAVKGETIHVICEVTDNGQPPITRYARVILTVE